tara:strand:+ start:1616 stop:4012 length:2397 start_codon:yes stop_codon:yes gene_type:complete
MKQEILTGTDFTEFINKKLLEKLLSRPELLGTWTDGYGVERDDRQALIKILTGMTGNKLSVKYSYSKKTSSKNPIGRVYPKGSVSLGSLGRKIRGTLSTGTYIDIDIKNCHATFILHLLKKYGFQHATFDNYVNNRDAYLNKIKTSYNCSRDEAKKFFIIVGYGGSYNSWYNGLAGESQLQGESQEPLWNSFKTEAKLLANKFIDTNQEIFTQWKDARTKDYNYDFGFLGIMLQDFERQVLETMVSFFQKEGLIRNHNAVLIHDGLMLNIKYIKKETLERLEQEIKKKHEGLQVSIIHKPFEHYLDELKEEPLIAEGEPMDMEYLINLKTYGEKKEYFERYVCKIMKTSEFIELHINIDDNGFKTYTHTTKKEMTLVQSYKHFLSHQLFTEEDVAKKSKPKPFINKWITDSKMRTYMDMDWIPYNGMYAQTDKRIFNLFSGYSSVITSPLPNNYINYINPFLDILLNLCEGNHVNLNFLLHYLAHIIQKPSEKLPFCIIFTGKQGAGKDTIMIAMSKILGTDTINSESNPENLLGTHAVGLVKKLLVAFNESEAKNTFDYVGVMKTLITEDKLTVNPKYVQPYNILQRARLFVFSNKANPIKFDGVSRDRRFIAWKTTDKYISNHGKFWKMFYGLIKKPEFVSSLYHHLNTIDLSNYDFEEERKKVLTDTYRSMIQKQLPPVVDFIYDHISKFTGEEYHQEVVGQDKNLWNSYGHWQTINRPDAVKDSGYVGTKKNFLSSFKELEIPVEFYKSHGLRKYRLVPSEIATFLSKSGWIDECFIAEGSEDSEEGCEFFDFL